MTPLTTFLTHEQPATTAALWSAILTARLASPWPDLPPDEAALATALAELERAGKVWRDGEAWRVKFEVPQRGLFS